MNNKRWSSLQPPTAMLGRRVPLRSLVLSLRIRLEKREGLGLGGEEHRVVRRLRYSHLGEA